MGYGPRLVRILLQFQLSDVLKLVFVEEVILDMGAILNTRKEHQATRELWEVSLHGVGEGEVLVLVACA